MNMAQQIKEVVEEFLEAMRVEYGPTFLFNCELFVEWATTNNMKFQPEELGSTLTELVKEGGLVIYTPQDPWQTLLGQPGISY